MPEGVLAGVMGKQAWWSVPLAVAIGVPMDAGTATLIQIVQALLAKGAALGTVLAFMMAVVGLSLPEFIMLRRVLRPRLLGAFIGVVSAGILWAGSSMPFSDGPTSRRRTGCEQGGLARMPLTPPEPARHAVARRRPAMVIDLDRCVGRQARLHPKAADRNIRDGDRIVVRSAMGAMTTRARVIEGVHPPAVAISHSACHRAWGRHTSGKRSAVHQPEEDGKNRWWTVHGSHPNTMIPNLGDPIAGSMCWTDTVARIERAEDG